MGPSESTFQQPKSISNLYFSTDALNLLKVMQTASLRVPQKFKRAVPTKSSDVTGFPIIVTASLNRCVSLWTMEGHLLGKLSERNLSVPPALIVPQDLRVANASIEGPNDYEWKLMYNAFDAEVKADRYSEAQRVVSAIRNASLESLQPAQRDFTSEKGSSILVTGTSRSAQALCALKLPTSFCPASGCHLAT